MTKTKVEGSTQLNKYNLRISLPLSLKLLNLKTCHLWPRYVRKAMQILKKPTVLKTIRTVAMLTILTIRSP